MPQRTRTHAQHLNAGHERTSVWLHRRDLELLRALFKSDTGYSLHIRAAVATFCGRLRRRQILTETGRTLLHRLGQLPPAREAGAPGTNHGAPDAPQDA